eukprot:54668-Eustigmatos_ZCMA.PRE.1
MGQVAGRTSISASHLSQLRRRGLAQCAAVLPCLDKTFAELARPLRADGPDGRWHLSASSDLALASALKQRIGRCCQPPTVLHQSVQVGSQACSKLGGARSVVLELPRPKTAAFNVERLQRR